MYAVRLPEVRTILFSTVPIPEAIRRELNGLLKTEALDDVELDDGPDRYEWPEGENAPDAALFESRKHPHHFRVFRHAREAGPEYEPTGLNHSTIHSQSAWKTFVATYRRLDEISRDTDESDTLESWNEIQKHLDA